MTLRLILFCANMILIFSVSWSAPVEEPISFLQQYFNQDAISDEEYYNGHNSNFTTTYRKRKSDEGYTSLCWAESLIVTEDRKNNNITLSKRYSIILESPINLDREVIGTDNTTCYEIVQNGTNEKRVYNFTTTKETDEYIVKEHKTLFCGAGPVLSEHFIAWPKLNKKQIEISINPLPTSEWRDCRESSENSTLRYPTSTFGNNIKMNTSSSAVTFRSIKRKTPQLQVGDGIATTDIPVNETIDKPEEVGDSPMVGLTNQDDETTDENNNASTPFQDETNPRYLQNSLLKRDLNCTSDYESEFCNQLLNNSEILRDFQSNSSPALVNLFFPNRTFLEFFRDFDGGRRFDVRGTFILEVRETNSKNESLGKGVMSRINVIEDSLVASTVKITNHTSQTI